MGRGVGVAIRDRHKAMLQLIRVKKFTPRHGDVLRAVVHVHATVAAIIKRAVIHPDIGRAPDRQAIGTRTGNAQVLDDDIRGALGIGNIEVAEQHGVRAQTDNGFIRSGEGASVARALADANHALHLDDARAGDVDLRVEIRAVGNRHHGSTRAAGGGAVDHRETVRAGQVERGVAAGDAADAIGNDDGINRDVRDLRVRQRERGIRRARNPSAIFAPLINRRGNAGGHNRKRRIRSIGSRGIGRLRGDLRRAEPDGRERGAAASHRAGAVRDDDRIRTRVAQ